MELIGIFTDEESLEGLYSIRMDVNEDDEWDKLMTVWDDPEYLLTYFKTNQIYLKSTFFRGRSIDSLINQVQNERDELECLIYNCCEAGFTKAGSKLQTLFVPIGKQTTIPELQQTKAKIEDAKHFPKPILRIYAIRIGPHSFVITGGAIKLGHKMSDHPDTEKQLTQIEMVQKFLSSKGIQNHDDIIYYYEQQS